MHSYPWYVQDWRASETRATMSGLERGLYRELLDACWLEGSLPAEETQLRRVSGFEVEEWNLAWPRVSQEFETRENPGKPPRLFHRKVEEKRSNLLDLKADRAESARRNGAKGGRPKRNPDNPGGLQEQNPEKPVRARTPSPSPSPSPAQESLRIPSRLARDGETDEPKTDPQAEITEAVADYLRIVGRPCDPPPIETSFRLLRLVAEAGGSLEHYADFLRHLAGVDCEGRRLKPAKIPHGSPPWGWFITLTKDEFPDFVRRAS